MKISINASVKYFICCNGWNNKIAYSAFNAQYDFYLIRKGALCLVGVDIPK